MGGTVEDIHNINISGAKLPATDVAARWRSTRFDY